jgi:hypothetical protein
MVVLWIVAGYCLASVVFYAYLVATAEPEPQDYPATSGREGAQPRLTVSLSREEQARQAKSKRAA